MAERKDLTRKLSFNKASRLIVGAFSIGLGLGLGQDNDAQAGSSTVLSLFNFHTEESLRVNPDTRSGRRALSHFLRDYRRDEQHKMSDALFDLLQDIKTELKRRHPDKNIEFVVLSGYRAPKTNASLRANGGSQAKKSRHMHGDAIDITVPGISTRELRDVAWCLQRGGVGYYVTDGDNFVHVDTYKGRTRDARFEGNSRYRAWGWSPKPNQCD